MDGITDVKYYYKPARGNTKSTMTTYKQLTIMRDEGLISEEEYKKCLNLLFNHAEEDTNALQPAETK